MAVLYHGGLRHKDLTKERRPEDVDPSLVHILRAALKRPCCILHNDRRILRQTVP